MVKSRVGFDANERTLSCRLLQFLLSSRLRCFLFRQGFIYIESGLSHDKFLSRKLFSFNCEMLLVFIINRLGRQEISRKGTDFHFE